MTDRETASVQGEGRRPHCNCLYSGDMCEICTPSLRAASEPSPTAPAPPLLDERAIEAAANVEPVAPGGDWVDVVRAAVTAYLRALPVEELLSRAIHVDTCPDCGTPTTGHGLDAPGHCPHEYERRLPELYIPLTALGLPVAEQAEAKPDDVAESERAFQYEKAEGFLGVAEQEPTGGER